MPFIDRDGARLYWRADGHPARPPLLLGNSLGTDQSLWDCVMPRLMNSFRVIRMDYRGHGASALVQQAVGTPWTIGLLAEDMLAVADAAGAERFHFAGISIGGMIGLWLGAHASHRLKGLLVSNTAARLPEGVWPTRIETVRAGGMRALLESTLGRWFLEANAMRNEALVATVRQNFLLVDPLAYAAAGEALSEMDLRPILHRIHAPTTVVTGRYDLSTPPALGESIATNIEGARCMQLPVAHIPHLDSPVPFVAEIEALLTRPPASAVAEHERHT